MKAAALVCALTASLVAVCPSAAAPLGDALAVAGRTFPTACSPVVVHGDGEISPAVAGYDWASVLAAGWQGPVVPDCEIWLRSDWPSWPWLLLCTEVVHEVGHLAGFAHSPDPADVMYATPDPVAQLGRCGLDAPRRRAAPRRPVRRKPARRSGAPSGAR